MTKGKRYLIDVVLAIFFYGILFFLSPAFHKAAYFMALELCWVLLYKYSMMGTEETLLVN